MTRRRIALTAYALAVAASAAYQTVRPGVPAPDPGAPAVQVPAARGPVRLVYDEHGTGPAVVLLHGSPGAVADFRHLTPHLSGRFRLLVPDLPGFGRSERWVPDYSIAAHAEQVLAWLDALGVTEFCAVGFSQGGGVALHLADRAPQRVRAVALVGGIGIQEGEGSGSYWLEHAKYAALVPTALAGPELVPHFGLLGTRSFRWTFFRNFWDTDQRPLRGALERLEPPLLVLHGRHDALVPAWAAVEHHRLVPTSELHLFDDTHFMLFDAGRTARLAEPLGAFLDRHASGPRVPGTGRAVLYGPEADLPAGALWPPAAQVLGPAALAAVWPAGGCLAAGALAGAGRADWFAAWLGALAGGAVRRRRAPGRWALASVALVVAAALACAAAGWWVVVVAAAGLAVWQVRNRTGGAERCAACNEN